MGCGSSKNGTSFFEDATTITYPEKIKRTKKDENNIQQKNDPNTESRNRSEPNGISKSSSTKKGKGKPRSITVAAYGSKPEPEPEKDKKGKNKKKGKEEPEPPKSLSEERKRRIEKEKGEFVEVTEIDVSETLVERGIITQEEKDKLDRKSRGDNRAQSAGLLELMKNKPQEDFDGFCTALVETGQENSVKLFVTDDDLKEAQTKLSRYYLVDVTHISMYTNYREEELVDMPKLYVPTVWNRLLSDQKGAREEEVKSPDQVLISVSEKDPATRTVILGESGVGKTTFIKNVCHAWAGKISPQPKDDTPRNARSDSNDDKPVESNLKRAVSSRPRTITPDADRHLKKAVKNYDIILALQLDAMTGTTLYDIILGQYGSPAKLSPVEIFAILNLFETSPDKGALLLDNFSRSIGKRSAEINEIVKKEAFPDVYCVTTSRPETIRYLNYFPPAVEQVVEITGFNKSQVDDYIEEVMLSEGNPAQAMEDVGQSLTKNNMLEHARIPMQLELICIAHKASGKVGETRSDVYETYLEALFNNIEQNNKGKKKEKKKKSNKDEDDEEVPPMMKLAMLANSRESDGNLKLVFSYQDIEEKFGEDTEQVLTLGCMYHRYPTEDIEDSKWSFNHRSIQEYLISYCVINGGEDVIDGLIERCSTAEGLSDSFMMLSLICETKPELANKILTKSVKEFEGDKFDNTNSQHLLLLLLQSFKTLGEANYPMLEMVELHSGDKTNYGPLFDMDSSNGELENLTSLDFVMKDTDKLYFDNTDPQMETDEQIPIGRLCQELPNTKYLKYLGIYVEMKEDRRYGNKNIKKLPFDDILANMQQLETLVVKTGSPTSYGSFPVHMARSACLVNIQSLCQSLNKNCPNLKTLDIGGNMLGRNAQHTVDAGNLECLLIANCCLDNEDLNSVQIALNHKPKLQKSLRSLDISHNNLHLAGKGIGKLIKLLPKLKELDLSHCNLQKDDITDLTSTMSTTKIQKLKLEDNFMKSGAVALARLINKMPKIQELYIGNNKLTPGDLQSLSVLVEANTMKQIRVLDISGHKMGEGDFGEVTKLVLALPSLEQLYIMNCKCRDGEALQEMFRDLPESLTLLDMSQNLFGDQLEFLVEDEVDVHNLQSIKFCDNKVGKAAALNIKKGLRAAYPDMNIQVN